MTKELKEELEHLNRKGAFLPLSQAGEQRWILANNEHQ